MTLIRTPVDCDNNFDWATTWLIPLLDAMVEYINSLESTQQSATDAVALEVGAARDGAATLLAKIKAMDAVSDDLKAQIESLVLGKKADIYDPSASYVKNDFVIYDTSIYVCLSEASISGVAPSDKSKWKLLLGYERAPLPTLAGPLTASEGTTHDISLGDSYDANAKYYPSVSGGSLSDLMQFTAGDYTGQWGWKWTMPIVDTDTVFTIEVYSTKDGYARSYLANRSVTVKDVPVNGATVDIADNEWDKTPDADGIQPPAYSNPADNAYQVVSAQMEIVQAAGDVPVLAGCGVGSDVDPLLLGADVNVGGTLFTDTGNPVVQSVSVSGSETTYQESGTPADDIVNSNLWSSINLTVPNGERVTKLGFKNSGQAASGTLIIYRVDTETTVVPGSSGSYETVAAVNFVYGESGSYEFFELAEPYLIPSDGKQYRLGVLVASGYLGKVDGAGSVGIYTSEQSSVVGDVWGAELDTYLSTVGAITSDLAYSVSVSPTLPAPPTTVYKKPDTNTLALGAGLVGEYMGAEVALPLGVGSTESALVFSTTESVKNKIILAGGSSVGGTGAALIPDFTGATYDIETSSATVEGWVVGETVKVNDNYAAYKARQNDAATVVPAYLPSFASGGTSGYALITAPSAVAVGALILAGGIPSGLTKVPPANIVLDYKDSEGTWQNALTTTEDRWNTDWQEFEYTFDAVSATEWRIQCGSDEVIHRFQLVEPSSQTLVADPDALHNDIEIDGVRHRVASVSEVVSPGESTVEGTFGNAQTNSRQMGYISGIGERNPGLLYVPDNPVISAVTVNNTATTNIVLVAKVYATDELGVATSVVGTSEQVTMTTDGDYVFTFAEPVNVAVGEEYWITIEYISGSDDWACGVCAYDYTGPYGSGYFDASSEDASTMQATDSQMAWGDEIWRIKIESTSSHLYTTTATLETPLAQDPTGSENVVIPARCTLAPAALTAQVTNGDLKITSDMITLADNPNIKRLGMAVNGSADMRFKSGKIYIQEKR